MILQGMVNKCL